MLAFAISILMPMPFILTGHHWAGYLAVGVIFLGWVGRGSLGYHHDIFSKAMWPCFIPGLVFCIFSMPPLLSSDGALMIQLMLLIFVSKVSLMGHRSIKHFSYQQFFKNIVFFGSLQFLYGIGWQFIAPHYFEPLIWAGYPEGLKYDPQKVYPTSTPIEFFYDDWEIAQRIEKSLPAVMETLRTSPFFDLSYKLVLIQKPADALAKIIEDNHLCQILGAQNPMNQKAYYFTDKIETSGYAPFYHSHRDRDRAVIIHELSHQILARYYGPWKAFLFIELWKNEGYAEYMAAQGFYKNKSELVAILEGNEVSDEILAHPFATYSKRQDVLSFNDYIAAMIQTRYALDVK